MVVYSAVVVFCSGLVVFCSVLVGSSPVSSTLVGSCLVCSALVGSCPVCSALLGFCPVCSALVGSCPVCSALLGFCPVCSAMVLCPADSALVPSLSISTWTWTSNPPPVPPLLHRLLDHIKIGSSVSRSFGGGGGVCYESGLWTSVHSPPEVTCSPHGLLHHADCYMSLRTTFTIIHCTDCTYTAGCTDHTMDAPNTRSPKSYYTHYIRPTQILF